MTTPSISTDNPSAQPSSRHEQGKYRNHTFTPRQGFGTTLRIIWNMTFHKPRATRPAGAIEVQPLTRATLLAAPNNSVWRLGHSTVLLKLRDKFWLTDPVFSERASPVQWVGPKRFHCLLYTSPSPRDRG